MNKKVLLTGMGLALLSATTMAAFASTNPVTIRVFNQTNLVCNQQGQLSSCKKIKSYDGVAVKSEEGYGDAKHTFTMSVGNTHTVSEYTISFTQMKGVSFTVMNAPHHFTSRRLFIFGRNLVNRSTYRLYTYEANHQYRIGLAPFFV